MVICNPPYIPRPGERNNNAYEGLGLIAKFAQRGRRLLADDHLSARGAIPAQGERGYRLWHELRMYACRPHH